jgi:nicotinate-nucleotide pyrophosphorylase (carboxylating)
MQLLSGVATLTREFVKRVTGSNMQILDTRKTVPGLRVLQKYAVRVGGGKNHRSRLDEMLLVKDNHLQALGGINALVGYLKEARPNLPLVVEVANEADIDPLLACQLDRIMLDNFSPAEVSRAVKLINGRAEIEVSGGITLENVAAYAQAGPNYASVGQLTHSAIAIDISLEFE